MLGLLGLPLSGNTEGKGTWSLRAFPLPSLLRNVSDVIKRAGTKTDAFPKHKAPPGTTNRNIRLTRVVIGSHSHFRVGPSRMVLSVIVNPSSPQVSDHSFSTWGVYQVSPGGRKHGPSFCTHTDRRADSLRTRAHTRNAIGYNQLMCLRGRREVFVFRREGVYLQSRLPTGGSHVALNDDALLP